MIYAFDLRCFQCSPTILGDWLFVYVITSITVSLCDLLGVQQGCIRTHTKCIRWIRVQVNPPGAVLVLGPSTQLCHGLGQMGFGRSPFEDLYKVNESILDLAGLVWDCRSKPILYLTTDFWM